MKNRTYDAIKNVVLGGLPVIITILTTLNFEKATVYVASLTTLLGWATIIFKNLYDKNGDGKIDLKDLSDD